MGMSAADLAGMRGCINGFLPDTCAIARTNATVSCRVDDDVQNVRVEGLPHFLPLRRWHLTLPDSTDVRIFDALSVTGKGVYIPLIVANPQTYSVATDCYCVQSGAIVSASTTRGNGPNAYGSAETASTHLSALSLYPLGGVLLHSVSQYQVHDTFGMSNSEHVYRLYAPWPASTAWVDQTQVNEPEPVRPHDTIVAGAASYDVLAVESFSPNFLVIYAEIPSP